jgi:hypothetical protein
VLRLYGDDPEAQKALCDFTEQFVKNATKGYDSFDGSWAAPLASTLGDMAAKYPATRPAVLAALKDAVGKCGHQNGGNVEPIIRAIARCEGEAHAAYKDSSLADRPLAWADAIDDMLTQLEKAGKGQRPPEKPKAKVGETVGITRSEPNFINMKLPPRCWWNEVTVTRIRGKAYRVHWPQGFKPEVQWVPASRIASLVPPKEPFKAKTYVLVNFEGEGLGGTTVIFFFHAQVKGFKDGKYDVDFYLKNHPDGKTTEWVDAKRVRLDPEKEGSASGPDPQRPGR